MKTKPHNPLGATAKSSPDPKLHLQIERRAYEIWMAGGNRHGDDMANWLQAEHEVLAKLRQAATETTSARIRT
ncbi:MAG TPA: DUF2934 domain-containing protein [Candidatus Acidoferrales bacterium]|nr:DUF2934 domain-containing protein [Candidatus Acidoferrales bacterium]